MVLKLALSPPPFTLYELGAMPPADRHRSTFYIALRARILRPLDAYFRRFHIVFIRDYPTYKSNLLKYAVTSLNVETM